jgi:hypothetical protein
MPHRFLKAPRKLRNDLLFTTLIAVAAIGLGHRFFKASAATTLMLTNAQDSVLGSRRESDAAQRKTQAVDILKGVVETAADIQDLRTRMAVLTGALDLLWKYDEPYARAISLNPPPPCRISSLQMKLRRTSALRFGRRWECC